MRYFSLPEIYDLATVRKQVLLLRNLLNRMEYNERQNTYKLSGAITKSEHTCFLHWVKVMDLAVEKAESGK